MIRIRIDGAAAMDIKIQNADILDFKADLIALKHAEGFHGADREVASALRFNAEVILDEVVFARGTGIAAREAVFIGVGPLYNFRYAEIQRFGSKIVALARAHTNPVKHLALTIHGPGYGLDSEKALLSLIAGIATEWRISSSSLEKVTIVERSKRSFEILEKILTEKMSQLGLHQQQTASGKAFAHLENGEHKKNPEVANFGSRADRLPRLFVAMPFSEEYMDEFEIGFREAADASGYICERLDLESFTGNVVAEIKKRIVTSHGVLALLNSLNPNVFLEIGYSWAHDKETILIAKAGTKLPFDVSGHRCIFYKSIIELREKLSKEIASIKAQGGFSL